MRAKPLDLLLEFVWQQQVIAVEVLNEFTARSLPSCFSREPRAFVALRNDANLLRMHLSKLLCYSGCVVGRAIIYYEDLDLPIRLSKDARNSVAKHCRAVVDRDDRAN